MNQSLNMRQGKGFILNPAKWDQVMDVLMPQTYMYTGMTIEVEKGKMKKK